ncbi:hypothetical protein DL762_005503 [Monosporascus cannonballus]|uniref:Uncharacterized protein n=1 Tax=Monosporascus cannonballus TaxID=155416 RepID=A0ABY0H574_9PEZI|nr:hypothetical protein DL762_005503 [Monosporascus cannonballus]RYO93087.1 hypothetical protein DL763_004483 [Monosporascus cannonballus]
MRNINAHGNAASNYNLLDLSHALANRRSVLSNKAFAVVSHANRDKVFGDIAANFSFAYKKTPTIGFVFTSQGAQWTPMGPELMRTGAFKSKAYSLAA